MNGIIGQWSTSWFYSDPADEVLVLFPDGKGVFEYHWWQLSHYETFTYQIDGEILSIAGDKLFSYNYDQNIVEESPSTLQFSGKYRIREANPEEIKSGCTKILEFDEPLQEEFPSTDKFGQSVDQPDLSDYKLPENW